MFDLSLVSPRFFGVTLYANSEDGKTKELKINVKPPKLKVLRRLMNSSESNDIGELSDSIRTILSSNEANYKIPETYVDEMNVDEMIELLTAYLNWVCEVQKEKN